MRLRATAVFALLFSILLITATPVAASHANPTVVSTHDTGTEFNQGTLTNMSVSGSGASATVGISEVSDTLVEGYEDDNEGDYTGETTYFSIQSSTAFNGTYAARLDYDGANGAVVHNSSALPGRAPGSGDTFQFYIRSEEDAAIHGTFGETGDWDDDTYIFMFNPSSDEIQLGKRGGGSTDFFNTTSIGAIGPDTWYRAVVYWHVDNATAIRMELFTQAGTSLGNSTITDTEYSAGGLGFRVGGPANQAGFYDDYKILGTDAKTPAEYLNNHSATRTTQGFVNVTTATDVTATFTYRGDSNGDGTFDTLLNQTSGITTAANHTFTWSEFSGDGVRLNVTVESTGGSEEFVIEEEGVLANTDGPTVDNSTASPQGELSQAEQTVSIQVNDSDFPRAHGDSVTASLYVDGSDTGLSDTLTSNGTASVTHTFTGGEHTYHWELEDSYGHTNSSDTFNVNTPGNLTIREETSPYSIITGCAANVRFFETTDENPTIAERSDTNQDGNISLSGLPVASEFVATVKCGGYNNRTVVIDSIFTQQSAFLLNDSRDEALIEFQVDDRTGDFDSRSELVIQKAINRSEYGATPANFTWTNVAGDELGADDTLLVYLENEDRYRIKIQNDQGTSIILGPYTPIGPDTETLVVGAVEWPLIEGNSTQFTANITQESSLGNEPPVIAITYQDGGDNTENFNYSVFEAGNRSNEIDSGTASGTLGNFYAETNITGEQANTKWVVEVQYDWNGTTITETRVVGGNEVSITVDQNWLGTGVLLLITTVGFLYGKRTVAIGVVMMYAVAGLFMVFQLIDLNVAWFLVAGVITAGGFIRGLNTP